MKEQDQTHIELTKEILKLQKRISELEISDEERLKIEIALWDHEERYRTLFERIPVGIYRTTPEGKIIDANQSLMIMLGYPDKETLLNTNAVELFVDIDDRVRESAMLQKDGLIQSFRIKMRCFDGSIIWEYLLSLFVLLLVQAFMIIQKK